MMPVPYENATSGEKARDEIRRLLQGFDAGKVGFMDDFEAGSLTLVFEWSGRRIRMEASGKGWASWWLKENPWTTRRRCSADEWIERATHQGLVASNSILRDWLKGQLTAVRAGLVLFDHVFLPYMETNDGRTVAERYAKDLPLMLPGGSP